MKAGNPLVAVAYLRCSLDDQNVDAQRAAIEAWAAREGVQVAAWHVDQGVSGATPAHDRPALTEAFQSICAAKAGALVVMRRDRLARDVVIAATIERSAATVGARVVSADGAGNGEGAADDFMRRILDSASEYERALIKARTRAALQAKRAKGERVGTVPFGYRVAADGVHLEPEEGEQATVKRARELRLLGASYPEIVRKLAAEGHRSRKGRPLALASVHAVCADNAQVLAP